MPYGRFERSQTVSLCQEFSGQIQVISCVFALQYVLYTYQTLIGIQAVTQWDVVNVPHVERTPPGGKAVCLKWLDKQTVRHLRQNEPLSTSSWV